ncbi:hypothetical protein AKJ53_00290 [candidate division MSBL1 archaeon SCGC-AAA382F02]|uniref:PurM-like N-terminal domain-containing protein n=1 Tax=candidate division MSBL1 archaeon SCGC-AAA382F02 TaxID=1698282 RepID=A0A133VJ61_9EURY|nr:hypothetical protein AKJ53_00290 [candidate division MSBL1 archaeon SCGC-AAA382F02]
MTKYEEVGVDAQKEGIEVFESTIKNLFPQAFCTVEQDPDNEERGIVLHTDGAGSKPVQNYLHWKETGETDWFKTIGQDVLAMNLDDLICLGAKPIGFVDYIALNKNRFPKKEVLSALNSGFKEIFDSMKNQEIEISFLGGETADLPDQLKTLDVSGTIYGRVNLSEAITGENIEPGNLIVGLRSGGKTSYENEKNSGLMCNGITLARHSLMKKEYEEKYPEIGSSESEYYGDFAFDDYKNELGMTVGEAILSPTRIFAPVIKEVLDKHQEQITGIVHNTGGGQTKSLALGENIHYVKDNLIEPDPIFSLIQKSSGEEWKAMFEDFNMGTGFEIMIKEDYAEDVLKIAEKFNLGAKIIGRCEKSEEENKVTINSKFGEFNYGGD